MNANATTPVIMQQHDPNDDPFASLCAEYDANHQMVSPLEYGSGAIEKNSPESPEEASKKPEEDHKDHSEASEEDESSRHEDDDEPKERAPEKEE